MASGNVTVNVLGTREFKTAIALLREFVAQGNQQAVADEDAESLMAEAETFLDHFGDSPTPAAPEFGGSLASVQPDAGLREAAQAVVDRVDAIDPSFEAQPVPEIEALRAALRSTPAAPRAGDFETMSVGCEMGRHGPMGCDGCSCACHLPDARPTGDTALRELFAPYFEFHDEPAEDGEWCTKHAPSPAEVRAALAPATPGEEATR